MMANFMGGLDIPDRWISVDEGIPAPMVNVWVAGHFYGERMAVIGRIERIRSFADSDRISCRWMARFSQGRIHRVTHWRELKTPALPEKMERGK